jgi:hypothetical protein
MALLLPESLDAGKLKDVQVAMRKDLRTAAKTLRGKNLWFVAASDVVLADKTKVSLFVVSSKEAVTKAWELKLKGKKPPVLTTGTCTLESKDGKSVKVALERIKGDRKAAVRTARLAFKLDPAVKISDPQAEGDDNEDLGADSDDEIAALAEHLHVNKDQMTEIMSLARELKVTPKKILKMLDEDKKLEAAAAKLIDQLEQEA